MSDSLTLSSRIELRMRPVKSIGGSNVTLSLDQLSADELANGTGADQADLLYFAQRTLNTTTENLDLAGGLTDPFGDTLTFAKVKGLYIKCNGTTTGNKVTIGGAGANTFPLFVDTTDKLEIKAGAELVLWGPTDGYTVTAATGDILLVETNYNGTYTIAIWGTSS